MSSTRVILFLVALSALRAQQFEIGVLGGGAFLNGISVNGPAAPVTAGFSQGPAAGVVFGHNRYSRWSGEIRYLFEQRDPRLVSGSTTAYFSGQAHVLHYNMLLHTRPRKSRVQPYATVGAGVKIFRGTGAETAYRPLMEYAYLTRTLEAKPMLTVGGGVKLRFHERFVARFDLQNQITRFPQKIITPATGMALGGWLLDFVPAVGLGWVF